MVGITLTLYYHDDPCWLTRHADAPKYDGSEADGEAIQRWISINAFAARLFGAGVVPSWDNFAVWALRDSLETESANADVSVSVASEWLEHAGGVLRDKSSAADAASLDEAAKRVLRPGKLFDGESGLNQGRWAFWQDRLVTLAGQVKDPAVKARADRVIALVKS